MKMTESACNSFLAVVFETELSLDENSMQPATDILVRKLEERRFSVSQPGRIP